MKKFILKTIGFVAFFAVFFMLINAIYLAIIVKTDWDFQNRIESLNFTDPDYELLALGASTAFDAFDTQLMSSEGIASYNLAFGGLTVRTNYIQLKEYLESYSQKPEYVLLGLNSTMTDFNNQGLHPIVEVTMEDHKYSINDIPILKFKWLGFEFLKKVVSKKHRQAELVAGQLKFDKSISDHTDFIEQELDLNLFQKSQWLSEIARLCDVNGAKLILIEMPGYRETQNNSSIGPYPISFENGYHAELLNLNSRIFCEIFESEADWIGNSHLNESGAAKFTTELLGYLQDMESVSLE